MAATTMSLKAFVPVYGEESLSVAAATSNLYFPIAIQVPCEARSSDIMLLSAYDIIISSASIVSVAMAVILTVIASRLVWRAKTVRDRSPPTKTSFLSKTEEVSSSSRKVDTIGDKGFVRTRTNSCSDRGSHNSSGHSHEDDSSVWHDSHTEDESVASSEQQRTTSACNSDEHSDGDDHGSADDAASYASSSYASS